MSYIRRAELTCTQAELTTYADKVLLANELLAVVKSSGRRDIYYGDGTTPISGLSPSVSYDELNGLKTDTQTAKTGAETARTGAETAQTATESARDAAISSKTAAATSESNAASSAAAASTSADSASASATAASQSEENASTSATAAETSRDAAVTAKTAAEAARDRTIAEAESIYTIQHAPPIASLYAAIILETPTLEVL